MEVQDSFNPMLDRYYFDFGECRPRNGWAQVDTRQDASYYGNWTNPFDLQFRTFAEGDIKFIQFDTEAEYFDYIRSFAENEGLGFKGIDPGTGEDGEALTTRFVQLSLGDLLDYR